MNSRQDTVGNALDDRIPELPANAYSQAAPAPLHDTQAERSDEAPTGYKRTEVGVIPSDWDVELLGNLFVFKNGLNKSKRFFGSGTPIVNYMDVFKNPGLRIGDLSGRVDLSPNEIRNYEVRLGDVFFTRTSETVEEIGMASVMLEEPCDTVFSGFVLRARSRDDRLDDHYKQYCFGSREIRSQIVLNATYTTRALTNGRSLSAVRVTLPPKSEQRAIAKALSDVDRFYTALEALIAKKRAVKQAAIHQLITGKSRLPGFSGKWETKRLGDIASFFKGSGLSKTDLSIDGERRCIHYGELFTVYGEQITKVRHGTNRKGEFFYSIRNDVLMPTSDVTPNGLATASCISVSGIIIGGDVLVIRIPEEITNGEFLAYAVKVYRDQVMQLVSGTTVFHLYGRDMAEFNFVVPPIDEQTSIVTVLSDMEAEIDKLEQYRSKTSALKQSMMQQLLTGRVRLHS